MLKKAKNSAMNRSTAEPIETDQYGWPLYRENPCWVQRKVPVKVKRITGQRIGDVLSVSDGGDILIEGATVFAEEKEVDTEAFVKLYAEGVAKMMDLSKPAQRLFSYVSAAAAGLKGKDRDTIAMSYRRYVEWGGSGGQRVYNKGLKELLEKKFIYKSIDKDQVFINGHYFFNGNRMVFAKVYNLTNGKGAGNA